MKFRKISKEKVIEFLMLFIELLTTILFSVNVLNIIYARMYNNHWPMFNVILSIIFGGISLGMVIGIYLNNKDKIEKIFLTVALATGICFVFFIVPFNVPDEENHFIKAYDISLGNIFPTVQEDGKAYCTIAKRLETCSVCYFGSYKSIFDEISQVTDYNEQSQITCTAQGNSALLYIGPIIACIFARTVNLNILFSLYIGRILNLLIFISFMYFSIKKIPFGKLVLTILCLFPMMMQQASSCSADAILNSVLIYYIVHLIYLVFKKEKINIKDKIILFIYTILIAMFKYIYILVAGILFLILFNKKDNRKENLKTIGIMILLGSIFMIGCYVFNLRFNAVSDGNNGIDSAGQIQYIKQHPLKCIILFFKHFVVYGGDSLYSAVGSHLGWLNVEVRAVTILGFILLIFVASVYENNNYSFSNKDKIWIILIYMGISTLIKLGMYLYSTPVGCDMIMGIQGRYYTPILLIVFLCLIKKENNIKTKYLYEKIMTMTLIFNMLTMYFVMTNYI